MKIDAKTQICGVIGNPIEHSLSPLIHNAGYQKLGLNFIYLAFRAKDLKSAIKGIKALDIRGVSITLPHKIMVMSLLDKIEKKALEIGAVNTVLNENGKLIGFNTDGDGAIRALEEKISIKNKKIFLVGAGGAGRAIAFGLGKRVIKTLIIDKIVRRAELLAKNLKNSDFGGITRLPEISKFDILINATPIGMMPNTKESPIPKKYLHKNLVVFDAVYNPKETKLLLDAKEKGCQIVFGYKMFLYQAAKQFELFTGFKAPIKVMEKTLIGALKK